MLLFTYNANHVNASRNYLCVLVKNQSLLTIIWLSMYKLSNRIERFIHQCVSNRVALSLSRPALIVSVLQQAQFLQSWCRWILLLIVGYCLCRLWTARNCTMLRSGFMASWQMVAPLLSSWCVRMLRCRTVRSLWERVMHLSVKSASHSGTSSYYLTPTVAIWVHL